MSKTEDKGEKLQAPTDFDGPSNDRVCTDVLCALLFLVMIGLMSALGYYAVSNGDYRIVLYPMDYAGNVCGTNFGDLDMTEYPKLYLVNYVGGGVCVKECPKSTDLFTLVTYAGVFQAEGATATTAEIDVADYSSVEDFQDFVCTLDSCYPNNNSLESYKSSGVNAGLGYAFYLGESEEYLHRCILTGSAEDAIELAVEVGSVAEIESSYQDVTEFFSKLYTDLYTAKDWILGFGFVIALVISFVYTYMLRIPGLLCSIIWGTLLGAILLLGYIGYYSLEWVKENEDAEPQLYTDDAITGAKWFGYTAYASAGIIFLITCCQRKNIQLSIGIVKEATRSVQAMPTIIFFPVIQSAALIGFIVVWLIYAIYLASVGDLSTTEYSNTGITVTVRSFEYDEKTENMAWYLIFCFFWTTEFIEAVGLIVIARAVASWYFTRDKSSIGTGTVLHSMKQVITYHLGTAAFGSLIIAILQIIRAVVTYIQKKLEESTEGTEANKVVKCIGCMFQCCCCIIERYIRFINKHAYIQTAIFSSNFCMSARDGFFLILRNAGRIGAISLVSDVVIVIGKIFIACLTGGLAYYFMDTYIGDELVSLLGPTIFIIIIAYFVASLFFSIFGMACETILHCFVADEEMFGDGADAYAENDLKEWIDENGSS